MKKIGLYISIIGLLLLVLASSVSAFDYSINDNFDGCLAACLIWIENSTDRCVGNATGIYENVDCVGINITDLTIIGETKTEDAILIDGRQDQNFGGGGHDISVGHAFSSNETRREVIRYKNSTINNPVLNGTVTSTRFHAYLVSESIFLTGNMSVILERIINNHWVEILVTWNNASTNVDWAGEPQKGCNVSGTDYIAWSDGDPERNFTNSATVNKYYNWTVPNSWITEWFNGSRENDGFRMTYRRDGQRATTEQISFRSAQTGSATQQPFIIVNLTDVNITARDEYDVNGSAILINTDNVIFNFNGSIIRGDFSGSDTGLQIQSVKNNITVRDGSFKDFAGNGLNTGANGNLSFVDVFFNNTNGANFGGSGNYYQINFTGGGWNYSGRVSFNRRNTISTDQWYFKDFIHENSVSTQGSVFLCDACEYINFSNFTMSQNESSNVELFEIDDESMNVSLSFCTMTGNAANDGIFFQGDVKGDQSIDNCTIQQVLKGIRTEHKIVNITDNYFFNATQGGVIDENNLSNSIIANNIFNFTGNSTQSILYKTGYFPINDSGTMHNDTFVYVTFAGGVGDAVTANDQTVVTPTGSNDFYLCVGSIAALGDFTSEIDTALPFDCATVIALNGGSKSCSSEPIHLTGNGAANYSVGGLGDCDGIIQGFQDPPYIRFSIENIQLSSPINIIGEDNNISGNTFHNHTKGIGIIQSLTLTSDSASNDVMLNNFYFGGVSDAGIANSFCVNGLGNFYEESLTPTPGDCGQINITDNTTFRRTISVNFTPQDSQNFITYDVNASGSKIGTIEINGSIVVKLGTTNMTIRPFDGFKFGTNATVNIGVFPYEHGVIYLYENGTTKLYENGTIKLY